MYKTSIPLTIFSIYFLSSCGLLREKPEYVSVDSTPRGIEVIKVTGKKQSSLGKTPFFDKTKKGSKYAYQFKYFDKNEKLNKTKNLYAQEKCYLEWADPLIDRVPLVKTILPQFVTDFVDDYTPIKLIRGGKYECRQQVYLDTKIASEKNKSCHKFLIIPPIHHQKDISKKLVEKWIEVNFNKNKKQCDKVVPPHIANEYLNFMGFSHLSRRYGKQYILHGKLAQVAHKTKATHVVFLHHSENEHHQFIVDPRIYDLHTQEEDYLEFSNSLVLNIPSAEKFFLLNRLGEAFQFIPNGVILKFRMEQKLSLSPEEAEQKYSTRISNLTIPPGLRLTTVDFPDQTWGVNFRFSPSFGYRRWDRQYQVNIFSAIMALKLFAHTPIGTFAARWGAGTAHINAKYEKSGFHRKDWMGMSQYGIEYYIFLSERYFINLGLRKYKIKKDIIKDGDFNLDGYSDIYFSLGVYTPELKMKIKNIFY